MLGVNLWAWGSVLAIAAAQCPLYQNYALQRHPPFSTGRFNLGYQRPIPSCRAFESPELEDTIARLKKVIVDPDLFRVFENSFPNTLDTTIGWRGYAEDNGTTTDEELTFVVTGDIEAMWLRDSANQLQAYVSLLRANASFDSLASVFRGAINLQARYIQEAPFCNAFQAPVESGIETHSSANSDTITPYFDYYKVFSCNWELDSLASFLQLSVDYATATGDYEFFGKHGWVKTVEVILKTAESMTISSYAEDGKWQHTPYTYCAPYGGTPINDCNGSPHKGNIGLIRTFHRPSDDACTYQYLIPSNMMFSQTLNASAAIMSKLPDSVTGNLTSWMKKMSLDIHTGIETHGTVNDPKYGQIYAYEIDGYGSANIMDDPNIPSLLSAPYLSYLSPTSPIYQNTRRKILSPDGNPYFAWGPVISGIASPHTRPGKPWPMAVVMQILTSETDSEIEACLRMLVRSTDGLGLMHESVAAGNEGIWSRQWFSWANGLFGQAVLDLERRKPHLLKMGFQ